MEEERGTGLPAGIEAAWGRRERPTKGPKRGLSLGRVVAAAVNVASSDGLAAVSMGRVAADLGASTMSLYRYVQSKDELLALMVDAVYETAPALPEPDDGWRAGLSRWAWAQLVALRRHAWALQIPITGPPITPNQVAWLELGLAALHGTDLGEGEKLSIMLLISGFVRNEATLSADLSRAASASGSTPQQTMGAYGRLLSQLISAERFPALHAVVAQGVFDQADDPDAEFVFGLERVLDGVEALVRARGQPGPMAGRRPTSSTSRKSATALPR